MNYISYTENKQDTDGRHSHFNGWAIFDNTQLATDWAAKLRGRDPTATIQPNPRPQAN